MTRTRASLPMISATLMRDVPRKQLHAVEEHGKDEEQAQKRLDILAQRLEGALREILARGVDAIQQFANKIVHRPALFSVWPGQHVRSLRSAAALIGVHELIGPQSARIFWSA